MPSPESEPPDRLVQALAEVQQRLAKEKELRREERFLWVVVIVAVVDTFWLAGIKNEATPIVVGVLELIGLLVFALRMGIGSAVHAVSLAMRVIGGKEEE